MQAEVSAHAARDAGVHPKGFNVHLVLEIVRIGGIPTLVRERRRFLRKEE